MQPPPATAGVPVGRLRSLLGRLRRVRRETWLALLRGMPVRTLGLWRFPRRLRNRRALRPLEQRTETYAILNDVAQDYGVLHYYITPEDQECQLRELGFELVECLDLEGDTVARGGRSSSIELHYIARRA